METNQWRVERTLNVQGITLEELRCGDQAALRRDGEITERGSVFEINYVFDVIERALTSKREVVIIGEPGWVSGPCPAYPAAGI
ncbi:hypothetical protein AB0K60_35430 [Thermopolyspora sp. NPDC052614]|uniref:hypothetical protein n=1 Tax=Thermopolyspora sp. NPDC052614 TaxID=3155682 RepID=UPI00341FAD0D